MYFSVKEKLKQPILFIFKTVTTKLEVCVKISINRPGIEKKIYQGNSNNNVGDDFLEGKVTLKSHTVTKLVIYPRETWKGQGCLE